MVLVSFRVDYIGFGYFVSDVVICELVVDFLVCIVDFRSFAVLCLLSVVFWDIVVNVVEGISKFSC